MDIVSYTLAKQYTDKRNEEQKLKVAKVERELDNYKATMQQININQEATQKMSGYGIVNLPKNAAKGQVSNIRLFGLTAINIIKNGDFQNGTNNWSRNGSNTIFVVENGVAKITVNRSTSDGIYQNINFIPAEHLIYARYKVFSNTINRFRIGFGLRETYVQTELNAWNVLSIIGARESSSSLVIYNDAGTTGDQFMIDNILAIDLTATFGAGNEPSLEECDKIFANYFDGTKSTISAFRIRSVSEDETQESSAYVIATDADTGEILELRSLPNGIKDEVRVSEGKLIKRISDEVVLQESDIISFFSATNVDYIRLKQFDNQVIFDDSLSIEGKTVVEGFPEKGWADSITNEYTHYTSSSNQQITLVVPKGAYADLAEARAALAGTKLIYQLAEPVEIPIEVYGTLLSYPSGTVYLERILPDSGIYRENGFIIQYPANIKIKRIDKLIKYDYDTGTEIVLDPAQAVISTDKYSFTHPSLQAGDMVFVDFEYDLESTEGEMEIEYYDSRVVKQDKAVPNKYYKIDFEVNNGVPSLKATEV